METNERNALQLWGGNTNASFNAKYTSVVLGISFAESKEALKRLEYIGYLQRTSRLTYAITQHGKKALKGLEKAEGGTE